MVPLHRNWDLSPDGSRFLLVREDSAAAQERRIVVVHNWAAEVRRRIESVSRSR
jgi:hypothetical protein